MTLHPALARDTVDVCRLYPRMWSSKDAKDTRDTRDTKDLRTRARLSLLSLVSLRSFPVQCDLLR